MFSVPFVAGSVDAMRVCSNMRVRKLTLSSGQVESFWLSPGYFVSSVSIKSTATGTTLFAACNVAVIYSFTLPSAAATAYVGTGTPGMLTAAARSELQCSSGVAVYDLTHALSLCRSFESDQVAQYALSSLAPTPPCIRCCT